MKQRIKVLVLTLLALGILFIATGCGDVEDPYQTNDEAGYTVSVKYDANGGTFTTNTSVIVDSYNISENNKIALLSPDNSLRGNDAFTAVRNGYFFAGWYAERTEVGTDANGEVSYSYGKKWDFEQDLLEVDPNKTYTSKEPVLTLYAAWIPYFEIEFYALDTGELLETMTYDPTAGKELYVPAWDEETGAVELYDFPAREGYTFDGVYLDEAGTNQITDTILTHPGQVDYATGTATDSTLKVYVDWMEGEWYHIYTPEQFADNATMNGCYEIFADLDFTEETWPTAFMYGNFSGQIVGNGHTISNIELVQTNNSKTNAGLFGALVEGAKISDVTFSNVTVIIESGTRVNGTNYGLFAGTISENASLSNVAVQGSKLLIDSDCYFGVDDYSIGLVCGMGNSSVLTEADITCEATGDAPEIVVITVDGNDVTVEFLTQ